MNDSFYFDSVFYSKKEKQILKGVTLQFTKNNVCGLFGRNGSGKSTLIKIGAGQINAHQGRVFIDNVPSHGISTNKRFVHMAYLPQESFLPYGIKVKNLFNMFPLLSQSLLKEELINEWLGFRVSSLSSGQRRYLEVSFILSLNRSFVLLDQPFTGVEPYLIEKLACKISNYAHHNRSVLITDQYYQSVLPIVNDAYMLKEGRCYKLSNKNDLINNGGITG